MTYKVWYDPIIIDLDSDGLEFTTAKNGVSTFDVDGDGVKDKLAWTTGKDAMLVYDYNNDNLVTKFDELAFGSHLATPDPEMPDLQALAQQEFDANQDGLLDAADAKWAKFKVWQDKNSNGAVDAGELQTMAQAGVQSIALHANVLNHAYNEDVTIRGFTRVRMTDGRELQAGDARFGTYDPSTDTPSPGTPSTATPLSEADYNAALADWQRSHDALLHAGSTQFAGGLAAQKTLVNAPYRYVLPAQLFAQWPTDPTYVVTQADGSALPSWLRYDTTTRTLSGTPGPYQQGLLQLKVAVPGEVAGAPDKASGNFTLEVSEYNQAPVLYGDITMQVAREGVPFSFEVAPNLFIDRDATDQLTFRAVLADGSALPSWLSFDPVNLRFAGTPTPDDVGALQLTLVATDSAQASASETLTVYVEGINDAPDLAKGLTPFGLRVGQANSYTIPLDAFADPDKNDTLSLSVSLFNGNALPAWLRFDPVTRTLSGTPTANDLSTPQVLRVTATDQSGEKINTWLSMGWGQWGGNGNDSLLGGATHDYIYGETGNDTLSGGAGIDKLMGGAGDDTYIITATDLQDQVLEKAGEGSDTVRSEVDYTLPANVENLVLLGNAVAGTGNVLDNYIVGNAKDNILEGGGGNDTLVGGVGLDTAVFKGKAAGYRIERKGSLDWVVTDVDPSDGDEGKDVLADIESITFSDAKFNGQFRVTNQLHGESIYQPVMTALADGSFIVSWYSSGKAYSRDEEGIYAQRFNYLGQVQGSEFKVSSFKKGSQSNPSIAALKDGGFVVTWSSKDQDGSDRGIFAQRYNAQGQAQGVEFKINSYTFDEQTNPTIAALNDGGFVASWQSGRYGAHQDGNGSGIYAQRYNAFGQAQGSEFRVNTVTYGGQSDPSIAAFGVCQQSCPLF